MSFARYKALLEERTMDAETRRLRKANRELIKTALEEFCRYVDVCGEQGLPLNVIVCGAIRGLNLEILRESQGFWFGHQESTGDLFISSAIPKGPVEAYEIVFKRFKTLELDDITMV